MSQINKDTIITQCANGYRMATGTSDPIKYGELGTLISTLSNYDGIIITKRNALGYPICVDASHLNLALPSLGAAYIGCNGNYIPSNTFMAGNAGSAYSNTCTSIILPDNVNAIGALAFYNCRALLYNSTELHSEQWKEIGSQAFQYCAGFSAKNLSLPLIERIGTLAFDGYTNITNNIVTRNVTLGSSGHAVSFIGTDAFRYQSGITSITVYTQNGLVSDLTGAPWGAANATINYVAV